MNTKVPKHFNSGLTPWLRGLLALVFGLSVNLCFEPFNLGFLAWFALIPAQLLVIQRRDRGVFWIGSLFGFGYFSGSFWFLNHIFPGCGFLVALIWATQPGIWLWLMSKLRHQLTFPDPLKEVANAKISQKFLDLKKSLLLSLASACLWATLEWSRSWLFTGLPWNGLEVSQIYNLAILKNVSFLGPTGLCFLITFMNTSIAVALEQILLISKSQKLIPQAIYPKPVRFVILPISAVLLLITSTLVSDKLKAENQADSNLRVALIQGNFDPYYQGLNQEQYAFHMNTYRKLSMQALEQNPDLLFWPETPLPSSWHYDVNFPNLVKQISSSRNTPMIFGTGFREVDPLDPSKNYHFNSALATNSDGQVTTRYDKIHTVPYGEFMPFRYLMSESLYTKVDKLRGMGTSLSSGRIHQVFDLPQKSRIGVNICFDDIFSDTSRGFALNGANILSTITNDSWFHQSAGGAQHTAQSVLRAVETGLPLIRCGNTSESMVILPDGSIPHILLNPKDQSRFSRGHLIADVPFTIDPNPTFYLKHPFLSPSILSLISFLILFYLLLQYMKRKKIFLQKALNNSES